MRALIFDFDGTILDTETPELLSWEAIFRSHGVDLPRDLWNSTIGLGASEATFSPPDYLRERHPHLDREALRQSARALFYAEVESQPLRPGIQDLLDAARAEGLPVALASSATRDWIERHLDQRGLWRYFDAVFTGSDVARAKPHPELYLKATAALGVPPAQTVAIEDSPNGIAAARAAGCVCVAYPNPITRAMDLSGAHTVVESLAALPLSALRESLRPHL